MKCKSCKRETSEKSILCLHCGERVVKLRSKKKQAISVPKPKQLADITEKKDHFKKLSEDRWSLLEQRKDFLITKDNEIKELKRSKAWLVAYAIASVAVLLVALATDAVLPIF